MALTINRAQLVNLTLEELQVTGVGQTPAIEDYEKVDGEVDGLLARLSGEQVVSIQDDEAIPVGLSEYLAELLAERCARSFGKPRDPALRAEMEARIRRIVASQPTYEPFTVTFY